MHDAAPPPEPHGGLPQGGAAARRTSRGRPGDQRTSGTGRRRRRDRHGRGQRGPLLPATLPGARTRAERFDDLVLDAVEEVEQVLERPLSHIELAVEDVPPTDVVDVRDGVPLGRFTAAHRAHPARVVVYRRPVETRAGDGEDLEELVHHVVVEQLAHALGTEPEQLDPHFRGD